MSRPYATEEQYERWYIGECCRCGRRRHKAGSWPDGHVCRTCSDRAVQTRGTCPGCSQERALPGLRPGDGTAICTDCAGFSRSFACSRCGFEGKLHGGRLCALADRLAKVLDDGSGQIRPELVPLADSLLAMDNPLSGLTWLYRRRDRTGSASDLLRCLARAEAELTHEGLRAQQPWLPQPSAATHPETTRARHQPARQARDNHYGLHRRAQRRPPDQSCLSRLRTPPVPPLAERDPPRLPT